MNAEEIDRTLTETETALARERKPDLRRLGFWRAVAAVKRDSALTERYADRIGAIDRRAFEQRVLLKLPAALGLLLDVGGVAVGIALIALVATPFAVIAIFPGPPLPIWQTSPWRELIFLAGLAAILGTSHTLAHWLFGTLMGMRFSHVFIKPPLPQPGFKTDYASYLRTPAYQRAWMHASGAIVTKIVPWVALPIAIGAGLQQWAIWLLVAIGVVTILTDVVYSVRASDWKKFKREMRLARS